MRLAPGGSGGVVQVGTPSGETGLTIVGTNRADVRFDGLTFKLLAATGTGTPSSANGIAINTAGAVGIGTTIPQAKLHVYESGSAAQVIETGGGTNAWAQLRYRNGNGDWATGTSRSFNNDEFYIDRLGNSNIEFQLSTNGNLGLGIEPQAKLHIYDAGSVSHRIDSGGGTDAWSRIELKNANGQWNIGTSRNFVGDQLYFAREGSAQVFSIQPNGDTFAAGTMSCKVLTIRGGADVAEPFPMKEEKLEKGSVVVIDSDHPGQLRRSWTAYDRRVAGIVSGANGISPGIALHQEGVMDGDQNVALSGRVYVEADAGASAIEPGDLLTTSDIPGHAMKVLDHARAQGAVIGKAMSSLKEGKGMVLVLVTLQ